MKKCKKVRLGVGILEESGSGGFFRGFFRRFLWDEVVGVEKKMV